MDGIQKIQGGFAYGNTPKARPENRVSYNKETRTFSPTGNSKPQKTQMVQMEGRIAKMQVPVDPSSHTFLKKVASAYTFTGSILKKGSSLTLPLHSIPQSTARF